LDTAGSDIDSSFAYGFDTDVSAVSPAFADAYRRMVQAATKADVLGPVSQALIGLAVNAAATHLQHEAVVAHVRGARKHGASDEEIVATLQFAACLGIHTLTFGARILREESAECNDAVAQPPTERQQKLKERWIGHHGSWLSGLDAPLAAISTSSTPPWTTKTYRLRLVLCRASCANSSRSP
jgi:alkylhydroperoxidase/carboxymuconolactone decarboxylase family protein YurZ